MNSHDGGNLSIQTFNFHTLLEVENWDEAMELIKKDPNLAYQLEGSYMGFPLLTALMHQAPYDLVKFIMEACPGKECPSQVSDVFCISQAARSNSVF